MSVKASDFVTRFCVFAPKFGPREGDEERKVLFYHPMNDTTNEKLRHIGYTEACANFVWNFTGGDEPFIETGTVKYKEVAVQVEPGYFASFACSTELAEICRYCVRGDVIGQVLRQFHATFRMFFGAFESLVVNRPGQPQNPDNLRHCLAHFCPRYFNLLRLHLWPLITWLDGLDLMQMNPVTFLRVQTLINHVTEKFPSIRHALLLCNDSLMWHSVPDADLTVFYRFLADILLPRVFRSELQPESRQRKFSASGSYDQHPNVEAYSPSRRDSALCHGKFVTGSSFVYPIIDGSHLDHTFHGFPKVFMHSSENLLVPFRLVVYRVQNLTLAILVPLENESAISAENFTSLLDDAIGAEMANLASQLGDVASRSSTSSLASAAALDVSASTSGSMTSFPFVYYNSCDRSIKCTLTPHHTATTPYALCGKMCELRKQMLQSSYYGSVLAKSEGDYWLAAKKAESREVYILTSRKNASMVEINEEINKLCAQKFKNQFLLE